MGRASQQYQHEGWNLNNYGDPSLSGGANKWSADPDIADDPVDMGSAIYEKYLSDALSLIATRRRAAALYYFHPFSTFPVGEGSPLHEEAFHYSSAPELLCLRHPDSATTKAARAEEMREARLLRSIVKTYTEMAERTRITVEAQNRELGARVCLLEAQLQRGRMELPLYKAGALGAFVSVVSIVSWAVVHVGAPLHPIFAAFLLPTSIATMAMAFLVKKGRRPPADFTK